MYSYAASPDINALPGRCCVSGSLILRSELFLAWSNHRRHALSSDCAAGCVPNLYDVPPSHSMFSHRCWGWGYLGVPNLALDLSQKDAEMKPAASSVLASKTGRCWGASRVQGAGYCSTCLHQSTLWRPLAYKSNKADVFVCLEFCSSVHPSVVYRLFTTPSTSKAPEGFGP